MKNAGRDERKKDEDGKRQALENWADVHIQVRYGKSDQGSEWSPQENEPLDTHDCRARLQHQAI